MRLILLIFVLISGCIPKHQLIKDYSSGNFQRAEENITKDLHNKNHKDLTLHFLNRGMIRFAAGNTHAAALDFKRALEEISHNGLHYKGAYFEQQLLRLYLTLALLNNNDEFTAFSILQNTNTKYPIQDALHSYLLAKLGDTDNANILRKRIHFPLPKYESDQSYLIVFCHNGLAPYKISSLYPASFAPVAAVEKILEQKIDPAVYFYRGIQVPELSSPFSYYPVPFILNTESYSEPLQTICDIGFLAEEELRFTMPDIAAKEVAKTLQGNPEKFSKMIADTRSWNTLPMTIDAAFIKLQPGIHTIQFQSLHHDYCFSSSSHQIQLHRGDLCILNVFNLHPGITKVVIPNKAKL